MPRGAVQAPRDDSQTPATAEPDQSARADHGTLFYRAVNRVFAMA